MDNISQLLDTGLGEYIAKRRDELLKKDDIYPIVINTYTTAMDKYEALKLPSEVRFIINEYILALSAMDARCEYACYLAGAADILSILRHVESTVDI